MKVLDPQSALLTNGEVYEFLKTNKTRPPGKKIGAYEPINLKDYNNVRQDFERYIQLTAPHVAAYPPPETYMLAVNKRLQQCGLTKPEAVMILNLGLGLDRSQFPPPQTHPDTQSSSDTQHHDGETTAVSVEDTITHVPNPDEENPETDPVELSPKPTDSLLDVSDNFHQYAVERVIENIEDRFAEDEREAKIEEILAVLKECIPLPSTTATTIK